MGLSGSADGVRWATNEADWDSSFNQLAEYGLKLSLMDDVDGAGSQSPSANVGVCIFLCAHAVLVVPSKSPRLRGFLREWEHLAARKALPYAEDRVSEIPIPAGESTLPTTGRIAARRRRLRAT